MNRFIRTPLFVFGLVTASLLTSASGAEMGRFTYVRTLRYGTERFEIYRERGKWICETQDVPRFVLAEDPTKGIDWKTLARPRTGFRECRESVRVTDHRGAKKREAFGCFEDPKFREIYLRLSERCRTLL